MVGCWSRWPPTKLFYYSRMLSGACMQMPQVLKELSEQSEVFCEGHNCIAPLPLMCLLQISKYSCPESFLDVSFGSSLALKFHSVWGSEASSSRSFLPNSNFHTHYNEHLGWAITNILRPQKSIIIWWLLRWLEDIKGERVELGEIPKERE